MFRTEPRDGSVVELIQKQVVPAVPDRAFSNTVGPVTEDSGPTSVRLFRGLAMHDSC
jgi:hypothetical protein